MAKKGDIVVRTGNYHNLGNNPIFMFGAIIKCVGDSLNAGRAKYAECSAISKGDYRMATQEEIQAYNQGIRNINDIKKITGWNW